MNRTNILALSFLVTVGTLAIAQAQKPAAPAPAAAAPVTDPRIDRILEQNAALKAQLDAIQQDLTEIKGQLQALRRRSS